MAALQLTVGALVATAAAAGVSATASGGGTPAPPSAATARGGVVRQAVGAMATPTPGGPPAGVFDVWDQDLFSRCLFGPADSGCAPAHRCLQLSECIGRCFVSSQCVVETPVGGACTPHIAQACASNSVCVAGVCTAAVDLPAGGIGLGDDSGTWVGSVELRQSLACADGLSCEAVYRPDRGSAGGILTDGFDPRICQRVAGLLEGCDSYASVVCGQDLICEQANTHSAAGVVPTVGADLGGVCRPAADRTELNICEETGTFDQCEHNEVCSPE